MHTGSVRSMHCFQLGEQTNERNVISLLYHLLTIQWTREGVFRDFVRQNRRRVANGYPPLSEEALQDPKMVKEFRKWKKKHNITDQ